jgi:alpha-tubulin suppressor-like RCC1 family protein
MTRVTDRRTLLIVLALSTASCSLITPVLTFSDGSVGEDAGDDRDAGRDLDGGRDAGPFDAGMCTEACVGDTPFCDGAADQCVECLESADCADDGDPCTLRRCSLGVCRPDDDPECIVQVAPGRNHTCARRLGGRVMCWGANNVGQLGDGSTTPSLAPVALSGSGLARDLASGGQYSCLLRSGSGQASCWGSSNPGVSSSSPLDVVGTSDSVELVVGTGFRCLRRADGSVACWGDNSFGQLGDGTTDDSATPVEVMGVDDAIDIAAGGSAAFHACAVRESGGAVCWGANGGGELGDGSTMPRALPVAVVGVTRAMAVSVGVNHGCVLLTDGTVQCWGVNQFGQIGDGTFDNKTAPVPVSGLTGVVEIAAGTDHTCARRMTGEVVCWGANGDGRLGDGSIANSARPIEVSGLGDAIGIAAAETTTCARRRDGSVVCWGANSSGQLGDGTTAERRTPTPVVGL